MSHGKTSRPIAPGRRAPAKWRPDLLAALIAFVVVVLSGAAQATVPSFSINAPGTAEYGKTIRVTTNISGGTEGWNLFSGDFVVLRGWHDHCGYCGDSCLVGDDIKVCTDCCYFGCFSTQCSVWEQEFSDTWFGAPTLELWVRGCGDGTLQGKYLGDSHEGPYYTPVYTVHIFGGLEAHIATASNDVCVGEDAWFSAGSSCGGLEYSWTFGDGGSADGVSVSHKYQQPGTYTVTMTGHYRGESATATTTVNVRDDCSVIEGKVTMAADGSALPGVTVIANGASGSIDSDGTAGDGSYSIIVKGDDDYSLEAHKSGFKANTHPAVHLDHGDSYSWNTALVLDDQDDTDQDELLGDQTNSVDDPVNPAIGNFYFSKTLFFLPGRASMNLVFKVSYNSKDTAYNGPLGYGWTHSYNIFLNKHGDNVTIYYGDGHREFYVYDHTDQVYQHAKGRASSLALADRAGGGYVLDVGGGIRYEFDDQGRLEKIADGNGVAITFSYSTHLDRITDASGRHIDFTYAGDRITAIATPVTAGHTVEFGYDAPGNLTDLTDARGNSWEFGYNAAHQLTTERDRKGILVLTNEYDAQGRITRQTDALGGITRYAYSATAIGTKVVITPPSGHAVSHEYDGAYNLVRVTDGSGKEALFGYRKGTSGQKAGTTDKAGHSMEIEAGELGQVTSITNRLGVKTEITYNDKLQPTKISDDQGRTVNFWFDGAGNFGWIDELAMGGSKTQIWKQGDGTISAIDDASSEYWTFAYNAQGLVTEITPVRTTNKKIVLHYDDAGRVIQTDLPDGLGSVKRSYDQNGNVVSSISPLNHETRFVYDENDHLVSETFVPTGAVTTYQYDDLGRVSTITDPMGGVTRFAYDADSNLVSTTDPDGIEVQYRYNDRNQIVSVIGADGQKRDFSYDENGHLVRIIDPLGHSWSATYDAVGRVTSATDPLGNTVKARHNLAGTQVVLTDQQGKQTFLYKDLKGRLRTIIDPDAEVRDFSYAPNGNLVQVTDQNRHSWRYRYDRLNRLTMIEDPAGKKSHFTYDARGKMISRTDRNGNIILYEYDLDGRLVKETLPDATVITRVYEYHAGGTTVVRVTEPLGTTTLTYDRNGRLISKEDVFGNTLGFEYSAAGRLRSVTYPGGKKVTYDYDAAGRLHKVSDWAAHETTYDYDELGRVVHIAYPNGTKADYGHDQAGRLTSLAHTGAGGDNIVSCAFTHDAKGRLTAANWVGGLAPKVSTVHATMTYDEVNRIATSQENGLPVGYHFDDNGNLLSRGSGAETTRYTYDFMNRLVKVTDSAHVTSYVYDAYGDRIKKIYDGTETRYLRNGPKLYASLNGAGEVLWYHIYGRGLLYSLDASGHVRVYHGDERGSVVAVSNDSAAVIQRYAYGPYGALLASSGSLDNAFRYLGLHGVVQDENGLIHMNTRYYDPHVHRFITEDPLRTGGGVNVYAYVDGDPVNRTDALGLAFSFVPGRGGELSRWIYKNPKGSFCPLENVNFSYKYPRLQPAPTRNFGFRFRPAEGPWYRSGVYKPTVSTGKELAVYEGNTTSMAEFKGLAEYQGSEAGVAEMEALETGFAEYEGAEAVMGWFAKSSGTSTTIVDTAAGLIESGVGLATGLVEAYIASEIAQEVGEKIGRAIGRSHSVYDFGAHRWISLDQAYQDLFLPGQIANYTRTDGYIEGRKWFENFLNDIGMDYSEYLKIQAEFRRRPQSKKPKCP